MCARLIRSGSGNIETLMARLVPRPDVRRVFRCNVWNLPKLYLLNTTHLRICNSMSLSTACRAETHARRVLCKTTIRYASAVPNTKASTETTSPSYYWDTAPPTPIQLKRAERFFGTAPPKLLFSATNFRTVNTSKIPEVAFLGRSNVGKSSLLNALMGQNICHVSSKPGRTRSMNFFAVGGEDGFGSPGKLAVLDMPGYGKGSREEWGPEIMKYLTGRKQYVKCTRDFNKWKNPNGLQVKKSVLAGRRTTRTQTLR